MIIELDTVLDGEYGPTAEDAARVITNGYDVTYRVAAERGPAGGWPIIAYEGDRDELRRMVAEHYGPDTVEACFPSAAADLDTLTLTRRERENQVRHLIVATGVNGAALNAMVTAIVDAWERDVEVQVARVKMR